MYVSFVWTMDPEVELHHMENTHLSASMFYFTLHYIF